MSKLLNRLNEYFQSTDIATQKRDWQSVVSGVQFEGPNAFEYLSAIEKDLMQNTIVISKPKAASRKALVKKAAKK